jgi:hypothetical protein
MEQNKTRKYFKYAIGEIILVVIGILIALQINNWNERRINANEELKILKALKTGLSADLVDLKFNANSIQKNIVSAKAVIKSLENNEPYRDSIADHFGIMMFPVKFVYSTSAFETLKSKGIGLVKNDTLRDNIVSVYDSGYNFFLDNEQSIFLDEMDRGLKEVFATRFEESWIFDFSKTNYEPRLVPLDFDSLKTDQEFLYFIKSYKNKINLFFNYHYEGKILKQVNLLISALDEEINRLEN